MARLPHPGSIVVGVDGSRSSQCALEWAAEEAQRLGTGLHLVHASDIEWLVAATLLVAADDDAVTDELLDLAVRDLRTRFPDLAVTAQVTTGAPAHDLIVASEHARVVVVGAHGQTRARMPLGSVAHAVAMHAHSPVVVVREHADPQAASGPVVVGVDGSSCSLAAVAFAMEQAVRRHTPLVAVHAWWLDFVDGVVVTTPGSPQWQRAAEAMRHTVTQSLAGACARYPDVETTTRLVQARPAHALVEASREASLVVVGARGRGGFAGLLLGSVSREVLMHAHGPVAVARTPRHTW